MHERFNNMRCWGLWSEAQQELVYVSLRKSDMSVYFRMIPRMFRDRYEIVRLDLSELYRRA